jgi:hypothetical protein
MLAFMFVILLIAISNFISRELDRLGVIELLCLRLLSVEINEARLD